VGPPALVRRVEHTDDEAVFEVLAAEVLAASVKSFRVLAPRVASHWQAGQFVIVRCRPMVSASR
jgi:NAD(P)H-flavin reductase